MDAKPRKASVIPKRQSREVMCPSPSGRWSDSPRWKKKPSARGNPVVGRRYGENATAESFFWESEAEKRARPGEAPSMNCAPGAVPTSGRSAGVAPSTSDHGIPSVDLRDRKRYAPPPG